MLKTTDLDVVYGAGTERETHALRSIDLTIEEGEFVTLLGPSGCGKSTLLHSLGGLVTPTGGSVMFDGSPVTAPDPRQSAYVFQDYSLLPWKNVVDNVAIGLRFDRVPKAVRRQKAMELLELVGLAHVSKSFTAELSGGMQQRVAVARALAMEPRVLLMDEPFGALDEQTRRALGHELSGLLARAGQTVVLVTHSLEEAIFWADRIVVMSARPGEISEIVEVSEPRPRSLDFLATDEFSDLRARLFEQLRELNRAKAVDDLAASEPDRVR